MNIERAIIKGMFYDYPIGELAEHATEPLWSEFHAPLSEVLKWRMTEFGIAETERVAEHVADVLYGPKGERKQRRKNPFRKSLMWLGEMLNKLLDYQVASTPDSLKVKFDELLRWRDLSLYIGEDLLTCAVLAWKTSADDVAKRIAEVSSFCWKEVLPHDNADIQRELDNGVIDLHSHLSTSADVFNLSWVTAMNKVRSQEQRKEKQKQDANFALQELRMPSRIVQYNSIALETWIRLASLIRYELFLLIQRRSEYNIDGVQRVIRSMKYSLCPSRLCKELSKIASDKYLGIPYSYDNFRHYDYATKKIENKEERSSPYATMWGERYLLYHYMKELFDDEPSEQVKEFSPYFFLYLRIKEEARKQIVMTNGLIGLKGYDDHNRNIQKLGDIPDPVQFAYTYLTSVGDRAQHSVEIRTNYDGLKKYKFSQIQSILGETQSYHLGKANPLKGITFFHGLSKGDDASKNLREFAKKWPGNLNPDFPFVGIDFQGSDTKMRPEKLYKELKAIRDCEFVFNNERKDKAFTIGQLTYHIGEDFYDLIDGLRTIEDVLNVLDWQKPCRLAHCLALATKPRGFYVKRGYYMVATKQVALDNLVWLYQKAMQNGLLTNLKISEKDLKEEIERAYDDAGYVGRKLDIELYAKSVGLRKYLALIEGKLETALTCKSIPKEDRILFKDKYIVFLLNRYKGMPNNPNANVVKVKLPRGVEKVVAKVQRHLISEIKARRIPIESCPSSNLLIGHFNRYDELPTFTFLRQRLNVSVNTDIKGVIATSIENEYSLLAAAMKKRGDGEKKILKIIQTLVNNAQNMKF